ncbi:MAG: 2-succinyl-5-enolpyruvyl-6-hydroxy-3-cyclohexene-1-carboxylic-acid synthase [Phycisphaerae bacterium]|nr:2-succinyl-5-enolpyruvyl-6-hydroxy-3-cyclohexene-1-carboxylic-acid synthase [Phycisphaerae bacterium]
MNSAEAENINYFWAQLLIEELGRHASLIVVCPGSRSSPLAIAAARAEARGPARVMIAADERCAGFIALGAAHGHGCGVVITTSGTAVANLLPAVVEASASERALIVVSADRPPEMRECGSNQTIRQTDIFGRFVRWSFELPCPDDVIDPAFVLSTADEALWRSRAPASGPVHLNVPFREPLAPQHVPFRIPADARFRAWMQATDSSWRTSCTSRTAAGPLDLAGLPQQHRGVIVAGDATSSDAIARLACATQWPVLADVSSGLRGAAYADIVVASPDLVLAGLDDTGRSALAPGAVLRVGGPISSKRLNAYVARAPMVVTAQSGTTRFDETHRAAHQTLCADLECEDIAWTPSILAQPWQAAGRIAEAAVVGALAATAGLTEPWIARTLIQALPDDHALLLGNSMPIRDADMHYPSDAASIHVHVNRGASGIDGLVSTAVGIAHGGKRSTKVLLGDLSLLHDLGGLANVHRAQSPVHIVVINNDGGGIFHFLPIADDTGAAPHFERLFGTPHGFSFEHAAAMFKLEYHRATTKAEAGAAFHLLQTASVPMLIECVTDRTTNVAAHRAIQAAVAAALARDFRPC